MGSFYKLWMAIALLGACSLSYFVTPTVQSEASSYLEVRVQERSQTYRTTVVSKYSSSPQRLDLLSGAAGVLLKPNTIIGLDSSFGFVFIRALDTGHGFLLSVKPSTGNWYTVSDLLVPSNFTLKRDGPYCIRMEDPVEPSANYYGFCAEDGHLKVQTVGEVEPLS